MGCGVAFTKTGREYLKHANDILIEKNKDRVFVNV